MTRILRADLPPGVSAIAEVMGFVRADIWRRYGGLGTLGKNADALRKQITHSGHYARLPVDGTIRAETTKDIVNDILTYKAAAETTVRKAIANRTTDQTERKRLYGLLRKDAWLSEPFLHRQMRKHFRHGQSKVDNQFIVRSDKVNTAVVNGKLQVTLHIAKQYGQPITLITTSSGKHVSLTGCNLRILLKDGYTEIHYATDKAAGRPAGDQTIGLDKGYTEAFVDSDGKAYGAKFGQILSAYSDQVAKTGKQRNRLHALEKQHRAAGRITKADRIKANNLGRSKLTARRERVEQQLRTMAYQSAHQVLDKANIVVSEDLTGRMASKVQWKAYNRRMSGWAKGVLAQALEEVSTQRQASHVLVNPAYTSQMDSTTGLLEGKRVGDKFYRANGDVLQADHNAARNVLGRLFDEEITRYMPYQKVKQILLSRSPAQLSVKGLELGVKARQPSADKFHNLSSFE